MMWTSTFIDKWKWYCTALHCWSQPSLCLINQMAKRVTIDVDGDDDVNKNQIVHFQFHQKS